jgi:tRNA A-37 threonylcarbamoyl transferase component Bud32
MKFGQYELRELIAVGGMAEVYKGRVVGAEGFEKWVAIKRILPDLAEDERFVKMLLTEARIHSALSHRNIVQIHDLGISESGEYFIVLEYVEGYDLRMITDQIAAQGEIIPEALSLHIASELAQGLHFAHELCGADGQALGLVHRDVSPSNVLISNAGEIKLSDFGLAKRRHDRSVVGSLKGNLAYMSPEQARQSTLDRRTDVFSLGAVLFELLTGKRLREITDEIVGWNEVASGHVPSVRAVRPDLPEAFERLLARALAPEPEQRFADAASFGTAIRAVLVHMNTPVGASDLQLLLSTLSPARRPRSLMPEQSKVIRLGPEAQALGEAIAAPATPRPLVAPGFTPVAPRTPGSITGLPPPAGPARPLAEAVVTPRPAAPLPPVQPWREHARGPVPLPRTEWPTPPGAFPPPRAGGPARLHSTASAAAAPAVSAVSPGWGTAGVAAVAASLAVDRRPMTAERLPTVAPAPAPRLASAPRPRRETARVVLREGSAWRPLVIAAAAALLIVAAGVHLFVVPLEVLAVWRTPASLTITSEPAGAEARLDGSPIEGLTPTRATVKRDRFNHVLQLTAPGYRPARQTVRFDGSVKLVVTVRMNKETGPTFEALPPPAGTTPARKSSAAVATSSRASAKVASRRSAKIARATAKTTKSGRGKGTKPGARVRVASKHH